ncbi:suppressor of fused homolog [Bombyx mori]|uniref:Suppressor of fused homolog n=1 Tax=Bombyx mori TaxID=7091 RepID=A0A8R2ALM3_BOMMO|nr:suppressor of fused homolog [Bombyx mori]
MSCPSGPRAPHSSGVPCNSALSFVASAQRVHGPENDACKPQDAKQSEQLVPVAPAGLKALCDACSQLYPDQPNPLQVTTRLKYWLGGQDPLDYISMYRNPGKPEENIPPHWHYISFGLSDLHGDGRVHPPPDRAALSAGAPLPSGCGIELTFRLAADGAEHPPLWPAALLQALARYVFTTGNKLCAGDHISWHRPLDGERSGGRMRHLLVATEPQLRHARTPHGIVTFLQMVGCTSRELRAAQRSSVCEVLKLIAQDPRCGGCWLVTRMERRVSVRAGGGAGGALAQLAGVSCDVRWAAWEDSTGESVGREDAQGLAHLETTVTGHMSTDSFGMSSMGEALAKLSAEDLPGDPVQYLSGVHVVLSPEGAALLPLAVEGRILHGAHFTWRGESAAVTLVAPGVHGCFVSTDAPRAARGSWLQILVNKSLASDILAQRSALCDDAHSDSEEDAPAPAPAPPRTVRWPEHGLAITVRA